MTIPYIQKTLKHPKAFFNINNNTITKKKIADNKDWDVIVIGGGATSLGIALDAVTRGYSTLLLEAQDSAQPI